jgi:transcriptional regulator with XRE-family HTH domain
MAKSPNGPRAPQEIDALLGQRIRRRRQELRCSQQAIGDKLGLSFQQVQKYEQGSNRVAVSRLLELADVLEAPLGYFLHELSSDQIDPAPAMKSRALDYRLLATFGALPDMKTKRLVLDLMRAMTNVEDDITT